jgi:hypothetical protein
VRTGDPKLVGTLIEHGADADAKNEVELILHKIDNIDKFCERTICAYRTDLGYF